MVCSLFLCLFPASSPLVALALAVIVLADAKEGRGKGEQGSEFVPGRGAGLIFEKERGRERGRGRGSRRRGRRREARLRRQSLELVHGRWQWWRKQAMILIDTRSTLPVPLSWPPHRIVELEKQKS